MLESALVSLVARLKRGSQLSKHDCQRVTAMRGQPVQQPARRNLVQPGTRVDCSILVVDGLLARYDMMSSGARQITGLYLPGDMCDLQSAVSPISGWGIATLTPAVVYEVPHAEVLHIFNSSQSVAQAIWRYTALDASILGKWVANLGRKSAAQRIAHLFCEMAVRSERAGVGTLNRYPLALTQEQLADATGMTSVHVNRMLRLLREEQSTTFDKGRVQIARWDALATFAGFDPAYLR